MPTVEFNREVLCAGCGRKQVDRGKGQTCEQCGCSPLPSYSYAHGSSFHPVHCKCTTTQPVTPQPIRKRRTPVPTLKIR